MARGVRRVMTWWCSCPQTHMPGTWEHFSSALLHLSEWNLRMSHNANVWRFIIISFIHFYDYEGSPEGSALPARIFVVVIKLLQSLRLCLSELLHWNDNGGGTGLQGRRLPLLALKTNVSLSEARWEEPVFEEVIRNPPPARCPTARERLDGPQTVKSVDPKSGRP